MRSSLHSFALALVAVAAVVGPAACALTGCSGSAIGSVDMQMAPAGPDIAMPPPDLTPPADLAWDHSLVTARPYGSTVPNGYDAGKSWPLLISLHGLSPPITTSVTAPGNGKQLADALGLPTLASLKGFLLAYPDGTIGNVFGEQLVYWNANDVCCQLSTPPPDDVAYLSAVISDMSEKYNVDPKRIFIMGLSNGGFMSHRLACDLSSRVAAIVSISGATGTMESSCQPTEGVSVLEIHGTADTTVPYNGGATLMGLGPVVGSAHATIQVWVDRNACDTTADTSAPAMDLDTSLSGAETTVENWKMCKPGGAAELWTIKGGMHVPMFGATVPAQLYDWLNAHVKP